MGFKDAGKPHYLGHRERLRRRFRDAGADALPEGPCSFRGLGLI